MASKTVPVPEAESPTTHRNVRILVLQLFGVFGAPIAWSGHELVDVALAGYACYPDRVPRVTALPGWGWVWPLMLVLCLLALVVSAAAGWVSYQAWIAARGQSGHGFRLDVGEARSHFLAVCGILTSIWFFVAIVFDTIGLFIVPLCGHVP